MVESIGGTFDEGIVSAKGDIILYTNPKFRHDEILCRGFEMLNYNVKVIHTACNEPSVIDSGCNSFSHGFRDIVLRYNMQNLPNLIWN